jgi:mRNA interferase MazF
MASFRLGEVLILPFSYTDLQSRKRRPAVVLVDAGDEDVLVAKITTKAYHSAYDLTLDHWREAGLLAPSVVRIHKLLAVEKNHVVQRAGMLDPIDLIRLKQAFKGLLGD